MQLEVVVVVVVLFCFLFVVFVVFVGGFVTLSHEGRIGTLSYTILYFDVNLELPIWFTIGIWSYAYLEVYDLELFVLGLCPVFYSWVDTTNIIHLAALRM